MDDQRYMNREIDEKFTDIKESLIRIETQTTKTNGRVTNLEGWQKYVLGFCACVVTLMLPVVYILVDKLLL